MTADKMKTVHKIEYWLIVVWLTAVLSVVTACYIEARMLAPLSSYLNTNNEVTEVSFDPADDIFEGRQVTEYSTDEIIAAKDITAQGRVRWTFLNPYYGGKCIGLMFTITGDGAVDHTITIRLQDENKTDIGRLVVAGQSGEVYIVFPYSNVKRIRIVMDKADDGTAEITSLRFIEGEQVSVKEIGVLCVPAFIIFLLAVIILHRICKKRYTPGEKSGYRYSSIPVVGLSDGLKVRILRTILLFMIFVMGYIGVFLNTWSGSVYCIAMSVLLLIVIGLLCAGGRLYFLAPKSTLLTWVYVGFATLVFASELIVRKRIGGAGLLLLVVVPFLVMQWVKMEHPENLLVDLGVASVATIVLLYGIRPYFENDTTGISEVINGVGLSAVDLKGVVKRHWNTLSPWGHSRPFEYFGGRVSLPFGFTDVLYQYGIFAFAFYIPLRFLGLMKGIICCFQKGMIRVVGIIFLLMNIWSAFLASFEVPCANWQWLVFYMSLIFIIFSEQISCEKVEN